MSKIGGYKFIILLIVVTFIQLWINSHTGLYVDVVGVLAVALLMRRNFPWVLLIIVALYADLIGHWYFGSHLLVIILLSFLTAPMSNFYQMCGTLQKCVLTTLFYALSLLALAIISAITRNTLVAWHNYIVDILIICPITLVLFSFTIVRIGSDVIY